jgi:hypothetical protein
MKTMLLLVGSLCLLLLACSPDTARLTDSSPRPAPLEPGIQAAAVARGKTIAAETFSLLSSNLQSAMASGGVTNALPYCSLASSPLTASIADQHGVTLRRISHRPRNPAARADADEKGVIDDFQDQLHADGSPRAFATNLMVDQATFFAPIVLNNELCLGCHGRAGRDIDSETLAILQKLYPQDEATGFALGELRGAWRIDIPLSALAESGVASDSESP